MLKVDTFNSMLCGQIIGGNPAALLRSNRPNE